VIIGERGDIFSWTGSSTMQGGPHLHDCHLPLCDLPLGDPPLDNEGVAGQGRDIGICECCGEEYYKNMTKQGICQKRACQRWRKRQNEVRRGR